WRDVRTALRNVGIGERAAPAGARAHSFAIFAAAESATSAGERNAKHGRLVEVNRNSGIVAVSDGAVRVFNGGIEYGAARVQLRRGHDRNSVGHSRLSRNHCGRTDGD